METQAKTDFIADGYYPMCNAFSIEVQINSAGDAVRYRKGENEKPSKWQQIKFNHNGEPYFRTGNSIIYLNCCCCIRMYKSQ